MKWIFIACLFVMVSLLTGLLRSQPKYLLHTAFFLGTLPFFVVPGLYVAPISWAGWPGPVKGVEVSLVDGVVLAVLFAAPAARTPLWLKMIFGLILLAVVVSTFAGIQIWPSVFFAWQLFRTALLFLAVFRLCVAVPNAPLAIISGLGVGLIFEAGYAALQYAQGQARPGGNLGHSNFLGLSSSLVTFPCLALALGGRRFLLPTLVVFAGLVLAIVGGSRATLGLFGFGCLLTIVLSIWHHRTPRKMAIGSAAALLLLVAAPLMVLAVERRSEQDKLSSNEERSAMKLAATMMITDHPLGVGGDQYVLVANTGGYSERAGVPWSRANRAAPVHSAYYLVTAEFGFLGLIGLVALLASFLILGFSLLGGPWMGDTSELVPGLLASMIIVCIHIGFEWVFMHFVMQYLFAIATGMLVALGARAKRAARIAKPVYATAPPVLSTTLNV